MKLVIDTNIILSALIRDSITRQILFYPSWMFYIPTITFKEIQKHKNLITQKSGLSDAELHTIFELIQKKLICLPKSRWKPFLPQAQKLMNNRDPKDIPFLATALAIPNDGIWTNDKDFEVQEIVKIWKTRDLIEIIYSEQFR